MNIKSHKPIILTFVAYYLPGYKSGGPVRTIANMVDQFGHEFDFRIVTADRDSFDKRPYPNVVIDCWNTVGKAKVFYVSRAKRSLWHLARLICNIEHDVLYLNSFFRFDFTIKPLFLRYLGILPKRPIVIAPRGEFSSGALVLKSTKKKAYMAAVKSIGLYHNVLWQASTELEASDIVNAMGVSTKQIVVAKNLSALPTEIANEASLNNKKNYHAPLRICFLSRISPVKNLNYALSILAEVKARVEFSIYGLIDDELYWKQCQTMINRLPSNITVKYYGVIEHSAVFRELVKHDLFFLPTRGENFGHAIVEALAAGLPVLISDQTPWLNLSSLGVGWDLSLAEPSRFKDIIELNAVSSVNERLEQRHAAIKFAKRIMTDSNTLEQNRALFNDLITRNHAVK